MNIPTIPTPENPRLVDVLITDVNKSLLAKLDWLAYAFGKCQVLSRKSGDRTIKYPGVYYKGQKEDYFSLFPDERKVNFSFFVLSDPYKVEPTPNIRQVIKVAYGLVLWFDLRTILAAGEYRNLESVKGEILRAINETRMTTGRIDVQEIFEASSNIYKEFSIDEIKDQYLMHPFAGLRFEGELTFYEYCR